VFSVAILRYCTGLNKRTVERSIRQVRGVMRKGRLATEKSIKLAILHNHMCGQRKVKRCDNRVGVMSEHGAGKASVDDFKS
jgi:hypothetical protein